MRRLPLPLFHDLNTRTGTLQVVDQIPRKGVETIEEGDAHGLALGLDKSTMSQRIHTEEGAQPVAAYSQATLAGPLVFVSGQIPLVPETGQLLGDDMQMATRQCIANAEAILRKAGLTLDRVVKASVFLTNMDDYADMDAAYREAMPAPYPAREAVAVQALPKGARVEISMIAAHP
jgi:2-iminobutanoate/2-iminopropanoate deaminase